MLPEECHKDRPPLPGFVYLMRNVRGYYKIGHSMNPRKRRAQLSSAAHPVRLILLIPTHDMIRLELELQHRYTLKRKRHAEGEWYCLDRHDINAIMHAYGVRRYVGGQDNSVP